MSERTYGQCARCGGNLTRDHKCSWWTVDEVVEEFRKEMGPALDDELMVARKFMRRQLKKIGVL